VEHLLHAAQAVGRFVVSKKRQINLQMSPFNKIKIKETTKLNGSYGLDYNSSLDPASSSAPSAPSGAASPPAPW